MSDADFTRDLQGKGEPVGLTALIRQFSLPVPSPKVRSRIVAAARRTITEGDVVWEYYPPGYAPADVPGQIKFALRYEPVDLGVYRALFQAMDTASLEGWVRRERTGRFARKAWYLFELLTGKSLDVDDVIPTGYVDLLDPEIHLTAAPRRAGRQRINDNLLGDADYCPLVRRTQTLRGWMGGDLKMEAQNAVAHPDPAILARAVNYLYLKETRSSFEIEGERPAPDRGRRFVDALARAVEFDPLSQESFVRLQNLIVDPRYAEQAWRTGQNYVSETLPDWSENVQYVCPKPEDVPDLMRGWMRMTDRLKKSGIDAVVVAAAVSFGFVFIHPFSDGNGRIHRFLVHHILAAKGFTPEAVVFPISALMLKDRKSYDRMLAAYASAVRPYIAWKMDHEHRMTVSNDTAHLYRYFDATSFAEYLYACVAETIRTDLRAEIGFLTVFDAAMRRTMEVVDMPNRRASLLVRLILQNRGKLSRSKREQFAELADEEILAIEAGVRDSMAKAQGGESFVPASGLEFNQR